MTQPNPHPRVLILGGTGMLGHKLWQTLAKTTDAFVTVRHEAGADLPPGLFDASRLITGVDAMRPESLDRVMEKVEPEVVVNCIGIVKQSIAASDATLTRVVNAEFPHHAFRAAKRSGARFIHISTDCVFSGDRGRYREEDPSDARDLYGRSKHEGETVGDGALTIRTSLIGRELASSLGLLEWFLTQRGEVTGYTRASFSGLTTRAFSLLLEAVIHRQPSLQGLYHVSSDPITKHELLVMLARAYGLDTRVSPDDALIIDRTLDSRRFREATGIEAPSWEAMLGELVSDPTPYERWRAGRAA